MARRTFVDTSGFYALMVKKDHMHLRARDLLQAASRDRPWFVASDYVLVETATLLNAQGYAHLLPGFFETLGNSRVCVVEWMDPGSS